MRWTALVHMKIAKVSQAYRGLLAAGKGREGRGVAKHTHILS